MYATKYVAPASKQTSVWNRSDGRPFGHSVTFQRLPWAVGSFSRYSLLLSLSLLPGISETAVNERVSIRKVVGNKAIMVRGEREFYLVQTSAECPALAHQEGRTVLVRSPDGFLGPQCGLMLDVWSAKTRSGGFLAQCNIVTS